MPCLLVKEKRLVKTVNFQNATYIGDPINAVKIFNDKEVDELILLDINAGPKKFFINDDCSAALIIILGLLPPYNGSF